MNNGKCIGSNKCRCPDGFAGNHCEINNQPKSAFICKKPCRNGICMANRQCKCNAGWFGRYCNQRKQQHSLSSSSIILKMSDKHQKDKIDLFFFLFLFQPIDIIESDQVWFNNLNTKFKINNTLCISMSNFYMIISEPFLFE